SNGELEWSTFLGGEKRDFANGIVLDTQGDVVVAGLTDSASFPVTSDAYDSEFGGGSSDTFITRFTTGGKLLYSTLIGDTGSDNCTSVAATPLGGVLVTGHTGSMSFPTQNAYQPELTGILDLFALRFTFSEIPVLPPGHRAFRFSGSWYATGVDDLDHDGIISPIDLLDFMSSR
ncbi:MAG: hypothetical protein KC964_15090, partial [Candidatus Omnitrophica bacterium]|nr:hypothetical protein [Candidatus Omnitrophota bacterium]